MYYIIVALVGMGAGFVSAYFVFETLRVALSQRERKLLSDRNKLQISALNAKEQLTKARHDLREKQVEFERANAIFESHKKKFQEEEQQFQKRIIAYQSLENENSVLKQDLRNIDIQIAKTQIDVKRQGEAAASLSERVKAVGDRYLDDTVKWAMANLNSENFAASKQRLKKAIEDCRGMGLSISETRETEIYAVLKEKYEKLVRIAWEREEQSRIKAQIRDEMLREKEVERELKQLDREREAIQVALDRALAIAKDQHSEEIEKLKERLAAAEAKAERAKSQAQLTKSGYVYVISNIGSFGDGVFKIGMTRRLEPLDRVRELGDASVPFPFDVHMMISCDDAPTLENAIHRKFRAFQVNKTNPRKEFFRTSVEDIAQVVKEHHGEVEYTIDPEAAQYRQSVNMSDEDAQYIDAVFDEVDEEDSTIPDGV